jgi:hypothetical protein
MDIGRDRRVWIAGAGAAAVLFGAGATFVATRGSDSPAAGADATPDGGRPGAGMVSPESLPGDGWRIVADTTLESLASARDAFVPAAPPLSECHKMRQFEAELLARDDDFETGTSRTLTRGDQAGERARLTYLKVTFDTEDSADQAMGAAKVAFDGDAVAKCLAAISVLQGTEMRPEVLAPFDGPDGRASHVVRFEPVDAGYAAVVQGVLWWSAGRELFALGIAATDGLMSEGELRATAAAALREVAR